MLFLCEHALNCSYCDTRWANQEETPFIVQSPSQVLEHILFSKIMHVTLTGGEPLLQKDIGELLRLLLSNEKINVEIETNGSIDISPFCNYSKRPIFTIDYKLDSSECMEYMLFSNFDLLCKNDSIKFVIGNQEDINTAISIVKKFSLIDLCNVIFSPVYNKINPIQIIDAMKSNTMNNVRFQLQLHKFIWNPNERGV